MLRYFAAGHAEESRLGPVLRRSEGVLAVRKVGAAVLGGPQGARIPLEQHLSGFAILGPRHYGGASRGHHAVVVGRVESLRAALPLWQLLRREESLVVRVLAVRLGLRFGELAQQRLPRLAGLSLAIPRIIS